MRKKRVYQQTIKHIYRPEMTQCLDCGSRLRRKVTISERWSRHSLLPSQQHDLRDRRSMFRGKVTCTWCQLIVAAF